MAGKYIYLIAGAALALLVLACGLSLALNDSEGYYVKHERKIEQSVVATGYFATYQIIDMKTLQLKNNMHGSGTIDSEALIGSNQTKTRYCPLEDEHYQVYNDQVYGFESNISFVEQSKMIYAPMAVAYGNGYYAKNPIVYNSKLKEKTSGKSYEQGVSMNHLIEYASAFQKYISVDLQSKDAVNCTDPPVYGFSLTRMMVDEEVVAGAVHIGELMTGPMHGWMKPLVEIDENYIGDIKLTRTMEVSTTKSPEKPKADWLSCCMDASGEVENIDRIWGGEEIFYG